MSNNNNPENNTSSPTPPASQPTGDEKARRSFRNLLWVIIVIIIGVIVGIISFLLIAPHIVITGGAPPFPFFGVTPNIGELSTFIAEHIILSTVSIALLVSLVIVYTRIYRQTKANFALGIFIVLLALLLEAIFTYPILQLYISGIPTSDLYYSLPTLGDILTILAYSVFLYLSLQ